MGKVILPKTYDACRALVGRARSLDGYVLHPRWRLRGTLHTSDIGVYYKFPHKLMPVLNINSDNVATVVVNPREFSSFAPSAVMTSYVCNILIKRFGRGDYRYVPTTLWSDICAYLYSGIDGIKLDMAMSNSRYLKLIELREVTRVNPRYRLSLSDIKVFFTPFLPESEFDITTGRLINEMALPPRGPDTASLILHPPVLREFRAKLIDFRTVIRTMGVMGLFTHVPYSGAVKFNAALVAEAIRAGVLSDEVRHHLQRVCWTPHGTDSTAIANVLLRQLTIKSFDIRKAYGVYGALDEPVDSV